MFRFLLIILLFLNIGFSKENLFTIIGSLESYYVDTQKKGVLKNIYVYKFNLLYIATQRVTIVDSNKLFFKFITKRITKSHAIVLIKV